MLEVSWCLGLCRVGAVEGWVALILVVIGYVVWWILVLRGVCDFWFDGWFSGRYGIGLWIWG